MHTLTLRPKPFRLRLPSRVSTSVIQRKIDLPYIPTRLVLAGLLLALCAEVYAQQPQQSPWRFTLEGGFAAQQKADLEDDEGAFSVDRTFISATLGYGWSRRDSIGISIGTGKSDYSFEDGDGTGSTDPWGDIEDTRVSLSGRFGFGQKGTLFIIPSLRFDGAEEASTSDSRTWGVLGGVAWRLDENLTIGPGVGVFSKLEGNARVFPILLIDWDISERWNLSTGRGLASSQGPGLTLSYTLNPNWSFGLSGRYEDIEFRLDDEGPAPGGIGRNQSLPLVLSARLEPDADTRFSAFMGFEFGGKLTLMDASDKKIQQADYDPAPVFGVAFDLRF
jgi:hypothetical protein